MERRTLRLILWLPLLLFVAFVGVVAAGLIKPPATTIPSGMVGQPVPDFTLAPALAPKPGLNTRMLATGRPHLVNVFASWCLPCVAEAPQLMALKQAGVPIEGIAVRDRAPDLADFLARRGDPYERIGADPDSKAQMAWGSSGVPETFLVDGRGIIRAQHIGDIHAEEVPQLLATIRGLEMRRLGLLLLALAAPAAAESLMPPSPLADTQLPDARQEKRAEALMEEIRCLVCQGQSIADSDAELAGDMRAMVRTRIAAGEQPAAIRAWLIRRYGAYITFQPPFDAASALLWVAPVVLLVGGGLLAARRFRRRRG